MTRGGIQNLDKNYKDAFMSSEFLSRYKQRKPVWPLVKFKSHFVNYVYELSDDMVEVRLISTGLVSAFLIESLNHEYGDSRYWRPYILTEKVDHWSCSLGNEAGYWAYETWENIRDLTSKSLKTNPNTFCNRLQASCQCAHNHPNRCSDCECNSWDYKTVFLEFVSLLVTCFLQVLLSHPQEHQSALVF